MEPIYKKDCSKHDKICATSISYATFDNYGACLALEEKLLVRVNFFVINVTPALH